MRGKITVHAAMYILLPAALLLLPIRWAFAWALSVSVHELGHYFTLRLCHIPIYGIEITPTGVRMATGELQGTAAVFCALAGPFAGFSLILLCRYLPCTAFCGWLQGMFNLLPLYPLDGGRVLRAILYRFVQNPQHIERWIAIVFFVFFLLVGIYAQIGFFPLGLLLFLFLQKFLANSRENRYNREKKLF